MKYLESAYIGKNEWWKYLVIIAVSFVGGQFIGGIPIFVAILFYSYKNGGMMDPASGIDFEAMGMNSTFGLALMLLPFVVSLILFIVLIKPLHQKPWQMIINGRNKVRWSRVFSGFGLWALILASATVIDYYLNADNYEVRFNLNALIPLAIVSFLLIPLQSFCEEVFFRGYFAQGIGRLTKNRWLAIIIPSIFFALMHGVNPEIDKYGFWNMMPQYFMIGAVYALVSVLDDGIEIAMGAHAANNTFLSIFVTADGSALQTDALLKANEINPWREFGTLIIASLIFIATLAFKYRWRFKVLSDRIMPNAIPNENKQFG
ncbi:MAG: CPBP family intramembrane metalloprotease [Carboxylicivirga sp.]|jgi:membrane protease YdiL (CAAX protease family)|nr:CPBP family intramembrane metalloprotease [Carboxylicivirga sp.]